MERHYYADESFQEIGSQLGICKAWACRLHARAVAHLRDALSDLSGEDA